jgi:hypothetical protein
MTMDIDSSRFIPIVVGIVSVIIGILIGWAIGFRDSNTRAAMKIRETEMNAEAAIRQAEAEARRAADKAVAAQVALPGITLLRLWLDAKESLQLDLDGQPVSTSQMPEPQRKKLVQLLTAMRPWIEARPAAPRPVPPPAPVPASAGTMPPLPGADKQEKTARPHSMVAQIDEILQEKLSTTAFTGRGIRLEEAPAGGVKVVVGTQSYSGVGDVPDPEIQAVLRAAIAEWEKKYTPG